METENPEVPASPESSADANEQSVLADATLDKGIVSVESWPPRAAEIRARARQALSAGSGNWLMYAGAFFCSQLIIIAATVLGGGVPILGVVIQYYFIAAFTFGLAALSLAVMRNGATFRHVFSGFGQGWRTLWLLGIVQCFVILWSLLLIVPGILAALSYSLVYLIRVDHPDWTVTQTIAESKRLMYGHRWRYFCLNLSFIGWWLVVLATCGLAVLFIGPYVNVAQAAFYEDLLDHDEMADACDEVNV